MVEKLLDHLYRTAPPRPPYLSGLRTCHPDHLTHILLGDYAAVVGAINRRAVLHYCVGKACLEGNRVAWIDPIPTGRNGEYISVMTRRIIPTEG